MSQIVQFLVQWCGVILSAIIGIIGIASASAKGLTKAEKDMKTDDDHYLVRYAKGGIAGAALIWIVGAVIAFGLGWLSRGAASNKQLFFAAFEIIVVLGTSIAFIVIISKIIGNRVWVNGEEIIIYTAFGKMQITTFANIRTVKKNGGETAATSRELVIRPTGGKRFKVYGSMTNFVKFAHQLDSKVELPNLTKKHKKVEEEAK